METCQSDSYPSLKFFKYIVFITNILVFISSTIQTKMISDNNQIQNITSVESSYLYTSNQIITKISNNSVNAGEIESTINVKTDKFNEEEKLKEEKISEVVYDNLTEQQLTDKLNRSLNSTLSGTGSIFARYTANTGMDPYLAVAIVLHETGCKWNCSDLVNSCNNVGGVKGGPTCNGGSYKAYTSLEEGINSYLDNLYYNYYAQGLTNPEMINPYYAESTTWASAVNNYIYEIRNT